MGETRETQALQRKRERDASAAANDPASNKRKRPRSAGGASSGASKSPPKELICPILHSLMKDPVSTADGHTFERTAIARWLQSNDTSPLTGMRLTNKMLTPNHGLRSLAESFASC